MATTVPPTRTRGGRQRKVSPRARKAWLTHRHRIVEANSEEWAKNERRLFGGVPVLAEVEKWDYEKENGAQYLGRLARAVYQNYPYLYAQTIAGHLIANAPEPGENLSFGTLGEVRRTGYDPRNPTKAELVNFNADGIGQDGSQWRPFWGSCIVRAIATGHMWMQADSPRDPIISDPTAPGGRRRRRPEERSFQTEIDGFRPYLLPRSPLEVPDFFEELGVWQYTIVREPVGRPSVGPDGAWSRNTSEDGFLVMVRAGFDGFDVVEPELMPSDGGFLLFDPDFDLVDAGDFAATRGDVPMWPLYWDRSRGVPGIRRSGTGKEVGAYPAMSKSGIFELGQAAVNAMNLESAAVFDAIDAAKSIKILENADQASHNLFTELIERGSQVTVIMPASGQNQPARYVDGSSSAVPGQIFDLLLTRIENAVRFMTGIDSAGGPNASGVSKMAGFAELMGPALSNAASHAEGAQNIGIHFLEQLWGNARPTGATKWPRKIDLLSLADKLERFLRIQQAAGVFSKTLTGRLMFKASREMGLIGDGPDDAKIETEFAASAEAKETAERRMGSLLDFGGDPTADATGGGPPPGGGGDAE